MPAKSCHKCEKPMKGIGTCCKACEREHFPGVGQLRSLMQRQRIPCACGKASGYVVDFRPVCLDCRRILRQGDCDHRKDWRERRGLCRECSAECEPGRKHCRACLLKARARWAHRKGKPVSQVFNERKRQLSKERAKIARDKCKALGLCMRCRKAPAVGCSRCPACVEAQRRAYADRSLMKRSKPREPMAKPDLYAGRADMLDPRGEASGGVDFELLSGISHVYVSRL
jgi:hypothetical protein